MPSSQNVLFLGASRGCGFFAALNVLQTGGRATFLLRKPETVTSNPLFQALSEEQRSRASLIQGDGCSESDVQKAIDAAGPEMNVVVSSIGGVSAKFSLTKGIVLEPPLPTTDAIVVLLSALHKLARPGLRLVIVSSMGIGETHARLPAILKPLFWYLLHGPLLDKEALEYLALRASKFPTPVLPEVTLPNAAESIPPNWLEQLVIVRPAVLTNGGETGKFRKAAHLPGAYTISRKDVGRFIADDCLTGYKWVGDGGVVLAY